MSGFSFLTPWRLLFLGVVVALAVAYVLLQRRRSTYAARFTNVELLESVLPKTPRWRRHVTAVVQLLAIALVVLAFAEPVHDVRIPRERATVMLALDVSLSMEATDIKPDRFEAAKAAAVSFLSDVPEQVNVGLVTFAGTATVRVAPTTDREAVKLAILNAELADGTAIGDAIVASLDALKSVPADESGTPVPAAIVLLSDGTTTMGTSNSAAIALAIEQGVPVSTIAFGTENGYVTLPSGERVWVPVDAPSLATIAERTGGKTYTAESQSELKDIYSKIGSSIGYETEQSSLVPWFVFSSLIVLAAGSTFALVWSNRLP